MMINHFQHLERYEGEEFGPALVIRGARERLAPILMTALATGLALVPLAIAGDLPGHEIEHPMAIVILGGLVTSTLLNLFVVPALYLRFGQPKPASPDRQGRRPDGRRPRLEARRGPSAERRDEPRLDPLSSAEEFAHRRRRAGLGKAIEAPRVLDGPQDAVVVVAARPT